MTAATMAFQADFSPAAGSARVRMLEPPRYCLSCPRPPWVLRQLSIPVGSVLVVVSGGPKLRRCGGRKLHTRATRGYEELREGIRATS